jgi:hypothetical protein
LELQQGGRKTYAGQFKHLGGEILEYGGDIDSCLGANAHLVLCVLLEEALDTTARELECNILAKESTDKARRRVQAARDRCGALQPIPYRSERDT